MIDERAEKKTKGVIISGGQVDKTFVLRFLQQQGFVEDKPADRLIAADAGLRVCADLDLLPAHIVGDFDSSGLEILEPYRANPHIRIHRYVPEKDYTDTEIAVELAVSLGWEKIYILGGTGTRLDHVLGNIQVLQLAMEKGAQAVLMDPHNRVTLHSSSFVLKKSEQFGHYVSLFAWGGDVEGLTLQGFAYPLEDYRLGTAGSLGVSNEITEDWGRVSFTGGKLLCIESLD